MSLVELLTAVAVTAVMMLSVYGALTAQQRLYGEEQLILELQQNLRAAFDAAAQTLEQAGYWRCVDPHRIGREGSGVKNALRDANRLFHTHPVVGFNNVSADSDPFTDGQTRRGTDVLGYSYLDPAFHGPLAQNQAVPSDPLRLVKNPFTSSLKKGQIVFVTACRRSALFQVTGVSTSGGVVTLEHDPALGIPGNATRCLQCDDGTSTCLDESACAAGGTGFNRDISFVHPVRVGYFRVNTKGEFQWIEGGPGSGVQFVFSGPRTLAENVEDFQVEFGLDLSLSPDGSVEAWVPADALPDAMPEDGFPDWERVTAVRCHLLGRTRRAFKNYVDTSTYLFADRDAEPVGDGYRRLHLMKTVILRNAMP
ncbi:PilW family protein [Desulfosoma sp.]